MKVFVIGSVRDATQQVRDKFEAHVTRLEKEGHTVHLPHRDTNQKAKGIEICTENMEAIKSSDEVHIFYSPDSQGSHFDMGVAFASGKKIVVVENVPYGEGKSYPRMLDEWQEATKDDPNEKSCPIHGKELMVDGVCHGTHIR